MKFEFDTTTDGAKEATALATALTVLYGGTIAAALDNALQSLEDGPATFEPEKFSAIQETDRMHPDNFGTAGNQPEPSAADAFGAEVPAPAPTPTAATTGPVDSAGIRWDERIHAGTKTTNKDGTWSRRRNTPDALFDSVMAELKGAAPVPPAPTTQAPPPPPPPPAATENAPAASAAPTTSAPVAASSAPISFPLLMVKITKAQMAKTIDKATVDGILGAFGMSDAKELAKASPDVVNAINEMVDAHING